MLTCLFVVFDDQTITDDDVNEGGSNMDGRE